MITQNQAFLWGIKAARGNQADAFNPFSNYVARAAWQKGFEHEIGALKAQHLDRLAS